MMVGGRESNMGASTRTTLDCFSFTGEGGTGGLVGAGGGGDGTAGAATSPSTSDAEPAEPDTSSGPASESEP